MIYAIYIALALVAFLWVLNSYKGGTRKGIDATLGLLKWGLIITAFIVAGRNWILGLLSIPVFYLSVILSNLLVALVGGASISNGLRSPPRPLRNISRVLGKPADPESMDDILKNVDSKAKAKDALLDYCEREPAIEALMTEFKISRHDLQELYLQLLMSGAGQWTCGHWVAASAVAYPQSLRYLLSRREENTILNTTTVWNLIMYFEKGTPFET